MRKITSILMLLTLCVGASWAEDTETIQLSTSVDNPENVYRMKNGNMRWMTRTSGPTANATVYNAAEFAFFDGSDKKVGTGSETAYKILCVSTGKWLSYTKAGGYDNKVGFAYFVDNQVDAEAWAANTADGKGDLGTVYQFRPYNNGGIAGKYMNWFQGPAANPSDNTTITVGLWQDNAEADNGSCWFVNAVTLDDAKAALPDWKASKDAKIGKGLGTVSLDAEALAAGETALETAWNATPKKWSAVCAAIEQCKAAYTDFDPVGKYFRIKNTLRGTYTGLDGYTLNMKNKELVENDPTFIWKWEKIGDKQYLKNVYAGLYPQYVNGGGDNTTQIGTSMDYAFSYAQHAAATETTPIQWNIFFGGRQVNVEENGNVNQWHDAAAHHYIYEVEATEAELATMCADYYKNNVKADEDVSGVQKIEIDENATAIISPSEFGAPREINDIIDNYKDKLNLAAADADQSKIHNMFLALANWGKVRAYQNAVNSYGSLLSVAYTTPAAEYGTIILPVNWGTPTGWNRFACSAKGDDNVLTLENKNAEQGGKNIPYIVQFTEAERNKTYQFIGYANGAATTNQTRGWLTGVLEESTTVPEGSYILSKHNDVLGFYKVAAGADYDAAKNRCYLTLPAAEARFEALFFEGDTATGINGVSVQNKQGGIFNIAGQRLSKLQKGLNIVNGKKIIVK